jgi:hypothetical protein
MFVDHFQCFTVPHIFWSDSLDSGKSGWIPGILDGFRWNVEELQIKEYESGNSRNSGWILGGFQA